MIASKYEDRRWKFVGVGPYAIMAAWSEWLHKDFIALPLLKRLPLDAEIVDVHWDPALRLFLFRVWSSTFEPVAEGDMVPNFGTSTPEIRIVRLQSAPDSDPPIYVRPQERS